MGVRVCVLVLLAATGCNQLLGLADVPIDAYVAPDRPTSCPTVETTCASATLLHVCSAIDAPPMDTTCAWGCSVDGGAHCAKLQPAGGGVAATDLDPDVTLLPIMLDAVTISDDGSIAGVRAAGTGVIGGIDFHLQNNVAVFRFQDLTMNGIAHLRGTHPIALVATGDLTTNALVEAQGTCAGTTPGPGGFPGGPTKMPASGSGAGAAGAGGSQNCSGGGGGGHGAAGGAGGRSNATSSPVGGTAFGDAMITTLVGGGGGGGGGFFAGGSGGGGGGAIQLVANGTISINAPIDASGCGGHGGAIASAGGGGGAGGTILIEAPHVVIGATGVLAVNGGGGGGSDSGTDGNPGGPNAVRAAGGTDGNGGSVVGGPGGAASVVAGAAGINNATAGGGGGGVGWLRLETFAAPPMIATGAVISPALGAPPATAATAVTR